MNRRLAAIAISLLILGDLTPSFGQGVLIQDSLALVDIYNSTNGAGWSKKENWKQTKVSLWHGVQIEGNRVTYLNLSVNNLMGTLPSSIGNLTALKELWIGTNRLTGSIATTLGNCKDLSILYLALNNFTGSIPNSIFELKKLTRADFGNNRLTGSLPSNIGNCTALQILTSRNNLGGGPIPSSLFQLQNLALLDLSGNRLTGAIPSNLGNAIKLKEVNLRGNLLTGSIPPSIGAITTLTDIDLGNNSISGEIPASIGSCVNLEILRLQSNQLDGIIPSSLFRLNKLTTIVLSNNKLTSFSSAAGQSVSISTIDVKNNLITAIPDWLGSLSDLQSLDLDNNKITLLPASIGNVTSLRSLRLKNNNISGSLPSSLFGLKNLIRIDVSQNNISGSIPDNIGDATAMLYLDFSDNQLTGGIPISIGNLSNLYWLIIYNNHISSIPSTISKCEDLILLGLVNNNLTGSLPSYLFECPKIQFLELSNNKFTGEIPLSIEKSVNLIDLDLNNNALTGEVPAGIWKLPKFSYLDVSNNELTGIAAWNEPPPPTYPQWYYLSNNFFSFEDLEFLVKEPMTWKVEYVPQKSIYNPAAFTVYENAKVTIKSQTGGTANGYFWYKDGIGISTPNENFPDYTLTKIAFKDAGAYTAKITSTIVPDLTLERSPVTLQVKKDTVYRSCSGNPVTINAVVADPSATYKWSTGEITSSIQATISGNYSVRIETANFIIEDVHQVTIETQLTLGEDIDTCDPKFKIEANIRGDNYFWETPSGKFTGSYETEAITSGTYILTISSGECKLKDEIEVVLNHFTQGDFTIEAAGATIDDAQKTLLGIPLLFTNTTGTGKDFTWTMGDGNTTSENNVQYTYTNPGTYTISLHGIDDRECPITVSKSVTVQTLYITNAISPNGDGKNDQLYIEPFLYQAELKIVNRWGVMVYEASDYRDDFSGKGLDSGIYYYNLYLPGLDLNFKGAIHIMK